MQFHTYVHENTPTEITAIGLLGFNLHGAKGREHEYINTNFTNLDIYELLSRVDDLLTPFCKDTVEKSISFHDTTPPQIEIEFYTTNYADENEGLIVARTFTFEGSALVAKHDFFRLPKDYRNKGIAKKLFRLFIQQYLNMNVKRIEVNAGLVDGGLIWAKNFFTADNKDEVEEILTKAKNELPNPQFLAIRRIFDNYYSKNPSGTAFPIQKWAELPFMENILRGSSWKGSIDLTNSEQFSNFIAYVLK